MTIADRLNNLITAKKDIKSAIIGKDVDVTGGLTSYADAIRQIKSGTGTLIKVPINTRFIGSEWTTAPNIETVHWTDMSRMFKNCRLLTNAPRYNTSSVTNMYEMFHSCDSLTAVPLFDTSNVTDMSGMFGFCDSLTAVPLFDTSNVTDMSRMFENCRSLSVIPKFDTSKVRFMSGMFRYIPNDTVVTIENIPLMDCGNVEAFEIFGHYSYGFVNVNNVGGFKDLGKSITKDYIAAASYKNVSFERAYILSHTSLLNIINNLYDISTQGKMLSLQFNNSTLAMLSDEDIAIATNKGWILRQ